MTQEVMDDDGRAHSLPVSLHSAEMPHVQRSVLLLVEVDSDTSPAWECPDVETDDADDETDEKPEEDNTKRERAKRKFRKEKKAKRSTPPAKTNDMEDNQ